MNLTPLKTLHSILQTLTGLPANSIIIEDQKIKLSDFVSNRIMFGTKSGELIDNRDIRATSVEFGVGDLVTLKTQILSTYMLPISISFIGDDTMQDKAKIVWLWFRTPDLYRSVLHQKYLAVRSVEKALNNFSDYDVEEFYEFTVILGYNEVTTITDDIILTDGSIPSVDTEALIELDNPYILSGNSESALEKFKCIATSPTDGSYVYASSDDVDTARNFIGISLNAGTAIKLITAGELENSAWDWDITKPLLLGTDGAITQTIPVNGALLILGSVQTPKKIILNKQDVLVIGG